MLSLNLRGENVKCHKGMTEVLSVFIGGIIPLVAGNLGKFSGVGGIWTCPPRMCGTSFKPVISFWFKRIWHFVKDKEQHE